MEPTAQEAPPHAEVGLTTTNVIALYRTMALTRALDRRIWELNREGRAPFVVSSQGHEGAQVASAWAVRRDADVVLPFYRDLGVVLALGMTPYEVLLAVFARKADPSSGGRQMPNHWGSRERGIISGSSAPASHLLHAAGLALASRLTSSHQVVFCYFGDGALAAGDFHESLNMAGMFGLPVVFIFENARELLPTTAVDDVAGLANRYGVAAVSVDGSDVFAVYGAARVAADRARRDEGPSLLDCRTFRQLEEGDPLLRLRAYLDEQGILPEPELGSLDDDIVIELNDATARAEAAVGPDPGDATARVWARPLLAQAQEAAPAAEGPPGTVIDALRQTQRELLAADERVVILGEDIGVRGGVFHATEGLYAEFGPTRVIDAPAGSIVGVSIGLALAGMRPIAEVQFADALHEACEQLVNEAARMHYRSDGDVSVPLVVRAPWGGGVHGGLSHSQAVEGFYAHVPGLKVVAPSTPADVAGLLRAAVDDPDPVLFLEHKRSYRLVSGPLPAEGWRVPIGVADVAREGTDCSVITYGMHRHVVLEAAAQLAREDGLSVEVLDLRTISPLDRDAIVGSAAKTGRALVVHEDNISFGVGAEVAAIIASDAFFDLDAPVRRLAMPDVPAMPFAPELENALMIGADEVIAAVRALCSE